MDGAGTRGPGDLQAEAASLEVADVVERVRAAIAGFIAAAGRVPDEEASAVLDTGEPGGARITETCARLVEDARWILHAAWMGLGPEDEAPPFPADRRAALAKLDESMESLFVHVTEADPGANLDFRWEHPLYGELNWREWLLALGFDAQTAEQDAIAMGAAGS